MIDDPVKTDWLAKALEEAVPIEVRLPAALIRTLASKTPDVPIPTRCRVMGAINAGDEGGGILCALDVGGLDTEQVHLVSITHLVFERTFPLFPQIDAYQRHRVKKLKRQAARESQWQR